MKKIDKTVLRETAYVAVWVVILTILAQAVFLLIQKWDYTVLLGSLLGMIVSVANFLLMGITVQRALTKDEKEAANLMKFSQMARNMMIILVALVAAVVPCFHLIAAMIPLFFPGIAVRFRPLFNKSANKP